MRKSRCKIDNLGELEAGMSDARMMCKEERRRQGVGEVEARRDKKCTFKAEENAEDKKMRERQSRCKFR